MSISLDTAGALVIKSSGTGANSNALTVSAPSAVAAARAIRMYDPVGDCNLLLGRRKIITIVNNVANPILNSDSGALIFVPVIGNATACTIPAATNNAGVWYEFISKGTLSNALTITSTGGGNIVGGVIFTSAGGAAANGFAGALGATVTMTATSIQGDYMRLTSDGTNWYVQAVSHAAAGVTLP
jgi:hypothetical protein